MAVRLRASAAVAAPALDRAADDALLVAGLAPQAGEAWIGRGRALLGLEVVEADADRNCDTLAADDAFAVAECWDGVEEAARAFGHGRTHAGLVAIVVQAHRDDRPALRQDTFRKVGRTLRNQAKRHTVLTAFLGNSLEDPANGLAVLRAVVFRHVAVRLFADEEERALGFGPRPDRIVEHHSGQHRNHDRGDLRRNAGDIDDRDWTALARQAEQ